jgi:hypothetical protein
LFEELLSKVQNATPAERSGYRAALTNELKAYEEQESTVAERKAKELYLTMVLVPRLQAETTAAIQDSRDRNKEAIRLFIHDERPIDECSQIPVKAHLRQELLENSLQYVVTVETPAARLALLEEECNLEKLRARAAHAEGLVCMDETLQAAKPLLEVNGGELELLLNGGRIAELVKLIIAANRVADLTQEHFNKEAAKYAANAVKLQ